MSCGVGRAHLLDKIRPCPRDPGADRADSRVADLRGLGVRAAEHLGEYERGAAIVVETGDEVVEAESAVRVRNDAVTVVRDQSILEAPTPAGVAHEVGARAPGDREQPGPAARLGAEAGERPVGAEEGVLGHVVRVVTPDEVHRQPPHVRLGPADRRRERGAVTVATGHQKPSELVHFARRYRPRLPRQRSGVRRNPGTFRCGRTTT